MDEIKNATQEHPPVIAVPHNPHSGPRRSVPVGRDTPPSAASAPKLDELREKAGITVHRPTDTNEEPIGLKPSQLIERQILASAEMPEEQGGKDVVLPSGRKAHISFGGGLELMHAQAFVARNVTDRAMVYSATLNALICELVTIDGEKVTWNYLMKKVSAFDTMSLQGEIVAQGGGEANPSPDLPNSQP